MISKIKPFILSFVFKLILINILFERKFSDKIEENLGLSSRATLATIITWTHLEIPVSSVTPHPHTHTMGHHLLLLSQIHCPNPFLSLPSTHSQPPLV